MICTTYTKKTITMSTSNLFIPSNCFGKSIKTNHFTMSLLNLIDSINSKISLEVINISYPKSSTKALNDKFYDNFSFKLKTVFGLTAKSFSFKKHTSTRTKNLFYAYLVYELIWYYFKKKNESKWNLFVGENVENYEWQFREEWNIVH